MLAYTTGTKNEADAGSLGLALAEQIRDDLIAHAAWELVEEFTAAAGNVRWYVFRCLATESGLPSDFFVVLGRTIATGELRFAICESYDNTTHTMSAFGPVGTGSNVVYDAEGNNPNTYVLGTAVFSGAANTPQYNSWNPGANISSKWWLIIDDDGFSVAFNGGVNEFVHVGAYTPLSDLAIALPLQLIGSSATRGSITRNPAVAGQTVTGMALELEGGGGGLNSLNGLVLGFVGDLRYNDKLQTNQRPVAEMGMNVYPSSAGIQATFGWALGKQKRVRVGASASSPVGFAFGDAYALDGTLWVPYAPTDRRMWDTGVAS